MKWYLRRTNNNPNTTVMRELLEAQVIMLSPFTPHLCEEAWEMMGKQGFVAEAPWPVADDRKIDEQANAAEDFVQSTMADIQHVLKLAKMEKPTTVKLFISPAWKYTLFLLMQGELEKTRSPKDLLAAVMKTELRQHGNEITKLIPKLCQGGVPAIIIPQEKELAALQDACSFFSEEFKCAVSVVPADASTEQKAKQAQPGKAAIVVGFNGK